MSVSVRGKNVYLSGPMSGRPDLNAEAFRSACQRLRRLGAAHVFNPCGRWKLGLRHGWYLRHDLHELTRSTTGGRPYYDVLVSLPGWEMSGGALVERGVAEDCEIVCCELNEVT